MVNRFGLPRDIPESVKREVRQRDGFGCVICGKAIIDYEHIDPEFADAEQHCAAGIVLLCIEHHGEKTRGWLSADTIKQHAKKPKCCEIGYSYGPFHLGADHPEIRIGNNRCRNINCILRFDGEKVLSVSPPEKQGGPFRISARIRDMNGNITLEIVNNEWRANSENWDVVVSGGTIKVRKGRGHIILGLTVRPPNILSFDIIDLHHNGHHLFCDPLTDLTLITRSGAQFTTSETEIYGTDTAFDCGPNGFEFGKGGGYVRPGKITVSSGSRSKLVAHAVLPPPGAQDAPCWCDLKFPHTHVRWQRS